MDTLIFIPSRKGNKRSEKKNQFKINNITLIDHTLKIAKNFRKTGIIFISSDDKLLVKKYKKYTFGYLRPKKYTKTGSNIVESILDALRWFNTHNLSFKNVLILPPTSPIKNIRELKNFINVFKKKKYQSLVSTIHMRDHPKLCVKKINNFKWNYLLGKNYQLDFDRLEKNFLSIDGNFSIAKVNFLKKYKSYLVKNKTKFFIQNRYVTIDVNEKEDLKIASYLFKKFRYSI